ncbi:MAG: hypothetical protein ACI4C5_03535 [Lachnospiraceae bacterium]
MKEPLVESVFCGIHQKRLKVVLIPTGQIVGEFMLASGAGRFADDDFARAIASLYDKYIRATVC